jgi:hypothetical protein
MLEPSCSFSNSDLNCYPYEAFQDDVNCLYRYLQDLKKAEPESIFLVEHFRTLFIDGSNYPEPDVLAILHRIVLSPWAAREFNLILNRCCYTFINHWWSQSDFKQAANNLVGLFQASPSEPALDVATRRLRELVREFSQTQLYEILQRYAYVEANDADDEAGSSQHESSNASAERLEGLVHRYPYLYQHYILDSHSNELGRKAIKRMQLERETKFEQDLLCYTPNLFQTPRAEHRNTLKTEAKNPTLLNDVQLKGAIGQFVGPSEGNLTYRDAASQFIREAARASSHMAVKQQIHDYLMTAIDHSSRPRYRQSHFNDWLRDQLRDCFPQGDHLKPNATLLMKTCAQLIEALIAAPDPEQPSKHGVLIDLHGNLGATSTISLLLKLVLLCRSLGQNVRFVLESLKARIAKQFASVFKHYERSLRADADWLVECLDNLMVAFTIHFGQENFSSWTNLLQR